MTLKRSAHLAIDLMKAECQRLAFNANLHDERGVVTRECVNASKRRAVLLLAIEFQESLLHDEKQLS